MADLDARTPRNPVLPKWMLLTLAGFFVVYGATVVAMGEASFLIPVAILAVIVLAYALANHLIARRAIDRGGSLEKVASDSNDAIPSPSLIPSDGTRPMGDTPEAHDEITPHDLPLSHPGRQAAEAQAAEESATESGTTSGDADPATAPPDGARG